MPIITSKGKLVHFDDFLKEIQPSLDQLQAEIRLGPHDSYEVICPDKHHEAVKLLLGKWVSNERYEEPDLTIFKGLGT